MNHVKVNDALEVAEQEILENDQLKRSGKLPGLKTSWNRFNRSVLGAMRFNNNFCISAPSGHGKSFMLNMIIQDFCDPKLNADFDYPFAILYFTFEMNAADEQMRTLSRVTGIGYDQLMCVDAPLTDEQKQQINAAKIRLQNRPIIYYEESITAEEIYRVVNEIARERPHLKLVVALDHTLLTEQGAARDEIEQLKDVSKIFLRMRKELTNRFMGILLSQMNDKIEQEERLKKPSSQYPRKTDLFGSKQLYHAMDYVLFMVRPELLHLERFGNQYDVDGAFGFNTRKLVVLSIDKARKGIPGIICLEEQLHKGVFEERIKNNTPNEHRETMFDLSSVQL